VPEQREPGKGTLGHVKGMAASVHLVRSLRGNVYPRLLLSVDYRDPKHIRLRAYGSEGSVADTLGANDLAEACLLAGLTVRYAETMHARKLRTEADRFEDPSGKPDDVRASIAELLEGFEFARQRFNAAAQSENAREGSLALFDVLNWAVVVDNFVADHWCPEGRPLGLRWRGRVPGAELVPGVRYARNRLQHQYADALREDRDETPSVLPFTMTGLVWRDVDELPAPPQPGAEADGRRAYRQSLEGEWISHTLADLSDVFSTVGSFLGVDGLSRSAPRR
jgi:hypothetical protein